MNQIMCLFVNGGILTDYESNNLYLIAQMMLRKNKKWYNAVCKERDFEVVVNTKFEDKLINCVGGVHFMAEISFGDKTRKVEYLVRRSRKVYSFPPGCWEFGDDVDLANAAGQGLN